MGTSGKGMEREGMEREGMAISEDGMMGGATRLDALESTKMSVYGEGKDLEQGEM